jgi:hypothetical protein
VQCVSDGAFTVCPFKLVTGVACPACGSTRAVLAAFEGENPLDFNPLGLLTAGLVTLALIAMCKDLLTGSDGLYRAWLRAEHTLRRPVIASLAVALIGSNWIWTIAKGL